MQRVLNRHFPISLQTKSFNRDGTIVCCQSAFLFQWNADRVCTTWCSSWSFNCYMVRDVARDFLTHLNGILANFNYCDLQTKYRQFVSYCTSYYGSCLWDLQHKLVDVFYTTWRKAIRRLFGLPRNAHCNLLPLVAACLPIQSQLLNRCANFVISCLNSNRP